MKIITPLIFALVLFIGKPCSGMAQAQSDEPQKIQTLNEALERLQVDTALLAPFQGIDYYPTWSPEGDKLGVYISGSWHEVDLDNLELVEASWRDDQLLGVINSESSFSESADAEEWHDTSRFDPRRLEAANGTIIELSPQGFSVNLRITYPEQEPLTLWNSEFENCHSLALSPDETMVAFICELNGIFVYQLEN